MKVYKISGYDITWDHYMVRRIQASSQEEAKAMAEVLGLAFACEVIEVGEIERR